MVYESVPFLIDATAAVRLTQANAFEFQAPHVHSARAVDRDL